MPISAQPKRDDGRCEFSMPLEDAHAILAQIVLALASSPSDRLLRNARDLFYGTVNQRRNKRAATVSFRTFASSMFKLCEHPGMKRSRARTALLRTVRNASKVRSEKPPVNDSPAIRAAIVEAEKVLAEEESEC